MKTIYVERLKLIDDKWQWVPEKEDFDLENDFGIDEENLEKELCRMSQILVRYGTVAAELEANLKRKEEYAKLIQARISGAIRSQYEKNGVRATEGRISEEVIQNTEYQTALASLHLLRAETIEADHWYRTANKKADMLNSLAFRQNAELRRGYSMA